MEKVNAEKEAEWSAMTEEERFFTYAEDRKKENYIAYPVIAAEGEGEEPNNTGCQEVTLSLDALKELERCTFDQHGCWIALDKIIPPVVEETSKKAPAKGKGGPAPGEEAKPVPAEAWLDLRPFMYQGATETSQKIFIKAPRPDAEEPEKKVETNASEVNPKSANDPKSVAADTTVSPAAPDLESSKLYEERHSYISVKVTLSLPISPKIDSQVLPRANNISLKASSNMPLPFPNVIDAVHDF